MYDTRIACARCVHDVCTECAWYVPGVLEHRFHASLRDPKQDAVVKLGDFGLAKDGTEGPSNATTQCGTPDYMAPEVLEGRPYEAAADIFSLGAVLYALPNPTLNPNPSHNPSHTPTPTPNPDPNPNPRTNQVLYALLTSRFPKMLALHVSQGKPLEWPPEQPGGDQSQARQLAECMLQLDAAKRGHLDTLAKRAATLPGTELLQGQSLLAREAAKLPQPPSPNAAAPADGSADAVGAAGAAAAAAAAAGATVLPSRPEAPTVREVTAGLIVLRWKAAPEAEAVLGYRVLLQAGGSDGFRECIADTGRAEPVVRLDGLSPSTWYEVKVCALSASGASPPSPPCSPVQTHALVLEAVPSSPPTPRRSASEALLLDESGTVGRQYAQVRADLLRWEEAFERAHGRPATEREKATDPAYAELVQAYKRLKQAKRRSTGLEPFDERALPREKHRADSPERGARGAAAGGSGGSGGGAAEGGGEDEGELAFSEEEMEVAARLFESYDTHQSGVLKLSEFSSLMQALSLSLSLSLTLSLSLSLSLSLTLTLTRPSPPRPAAPSPRPP